jgi:hypothetical protein
MQTVFHSGRLGDIICSLKACQRISERHDNEQIRFYIRRKPDTTAYEADYFTQCKDLLLAQPYISEVLLFSANDEGSYQEIAVDYNLDNFRGINPWKNHIIMCHLISMNLPYDGWNEPWLTVPNKRTPNGKPFVFIQRTFRYRNPFISWKKFIADSQLHEQFPDEIYFFGLEAEYKNFLQTGDPKVKFVKTSNMLELAEYISGASVVALNQTVGDVICWGLGKEHWLEKQERHNVTVLINRPEEHIIPHMDAVQRVI